MSTTSGSSQHIPADAEHSSVASRFTTDAFASSGFQVLIVNPDVAVHRACNELAHTLGVNIHAVNAYSEAETTLLQNHIDLILLDLDLNGPSGIQQLANIRTSYPEMMVVVVSAAATVTAAVQAMRLGAADYLTTPLLLDELADVIERALKRMSRDAQTRIAHRQLANDTGMGALVGHSLVMQKLYRIITKVAFTTHPVLILGDSGSGKELVARTIHNAGPNAGRPFVPVYCNTLTSETMERELFGYAKGAVPGASRARAGMLVEADSGTIFFDGIGELPLELQGRLVRVLQDREVRPVGSQDTVPIHARIIASAESNLPDLQRDGKFRRDLFFRLNIVNIKVPSLRERRDDIAPLSDSILREIRRESGIPYELDTGVRELLHDYDWPGNIRELESVLQRACVMASSPFLSEKDLPSQLHVPPLHDEPAAPSQIRSTSGAFKVASIAEMEKQAILNTIQQLRGDKLKAAKLLGIGKTTLYRKLKEYGIEPADPN